jgi:SAM-dependent methyltransferase
MISAKPEQTTHSCGCVNEFHEPTGALRRVSTCRRHMRDYRAPETLGLDYYTKLGLLKNGMLQPTNHVAELTEALGPIPPPSGNRDVLEIGCGVSPYAGVLIERDWHYMGVEPSLWACGWMRRIYGVGTLPLRFEQVEVMIPPAMYGLILAAHSLEHMDDAPGAIARCAELLAPGGQLWIVIPDDTDKTNPDHRWCFSQDSLWYTVEATGLAVEHVAIRRYVKHENFQYLRAKKPDVVLDSAKS